MATAGEGSRFRIRLRTNILAVMLGLVLSLALALIGYASYAGRRASLEAANELMDQSGRNALSEFRLSIVPPLSMIEVAASVRRVWEPATEEGEPAEALLTDIIMRYPQLYSIFIGYRDGRMFQVFDLRPEEAGLRRALRAPPEADRATRLVLRPGTPQASEIWRFLAPDGRVLDRRVFTPTSFDPRTRPWFAPAMASDGVVRTGPYRFVATGEVGMTATKRFLEGVGGAIGIDIALTSLTRHLHEDPVTREHGLMLIFRADGVVLASSQPLADKGTRPEMPDLATTADPLARALIGPLRRGEVEHTLALTIDGTSYVARLTPLPLTLGESTYLGIVVPVHRFTRTMDIILGRSVVVSAIIVLLFLPVMLFTSRMIARPLRRLRDEVEKIRRFELDGGVDVTTRLMEVDDLARSTAAMKSALRGFTRFVPRDLVRDLIASGTDPVAGGERRDCTLLFSDIAGFTDLAEDADPEDLMRGLSDYFSALADVLQQEGGTIDKFIGDAVMAIWNAPSPCPDHPVAACRAALRAAREVRRPELWARLGGRPRRTRFGIHTGEVVVGQIGGGDRLSYTAIGAAVNLAARLESLNRHLGTNILISEATVDQCAGAFLVRTAGLVRPLGLQRPLRVYELLAEAGDAATAERVIVWEQAFAAYLRRDWDVAERGFDAAGEDDRLAGFYRQSVASLRADPPDEGWTGLLTFTSK